MIAASLAGLLRVARSTILAGPRIRHVVRAGGHLHPLIPLAGNLCLLTVAAWTWLLPVAGATAAAVHDPRVGSATVAPARTPGVADSLIVSTSPSLPASLRPDSGGANDPGSASDQVATWPSQQVAPPLPILPPSPINPQLLKDAFAKLALVILQDAVKALREPLQSFLTGPLNVIGQTPPAGSYDSRVVTGLWNTVLRAANALLVIVVILGGLNVMLKDRLGIPYHEAAAFLGRAVVGAGLANTSLWLVQLAIDANNALCGLIAGSSLPAWEQAGGNAQTFTSVVAALLYLITGLFLILQMLMRLALIDVLIVVSPLALLCWILPQTHGWARRWSAAFTGAVFTQFVQIVALKLGAELFTDLTPATGAGEALLPSILGIAVLILTIRLPGLLGLRGGGGGSGVLRYIAYQQLRGR